MQHSPTNSKTPVLTKTANISIILCSISFKIPTKNIQGKI